ncbi:NAD-specific glutamate dehydrogenase [Cupriavidus sp. HMR-1]|nr:NAD-specific glutamate dehydrogenase [Cupriavidus sp. HMR-1]
MAFLSCCLSAARAAPPSADFLNLLAGQRALDRAVHAAGGKLVGALREAFDRRLDRAMVLALGDFAHIGNQRVDCGTLICGQKVAVGFERTRGGFHQTGSVHAFLGERAVLHVVLGFLKALLQHAGDIVIGQAIRRLDRHRCFHPGTDLAGRHRQQAVGIHLVGHADTRRAGHHRRNATQLEARQRTAVAGQLALALQHVNRHCGLAVLERGELLRARHGNRAVARDDLLDQPTHRFHAQRERDHVEQQPILTRRMVAGQQVRLHGCAQRHNPVRIEVGQRLLAKVVAHRLADRRHSRGATHQDHALHVLGTDTGVTQRLAHRRQRLLHQVGGDLYEGIGIQREMHDLAARQHGVNHRAVTGRQRFLRRAGAHHQQTRIFSGQRLQTDLLDDPAQQALVEVVATERRIAARRHHFEHTLGQLEHRDIEGATAQVIDGVNAFRGVVEAIGNRGGSRLVEQAQHLEARQLSGVLGGLTLCIVEVRRHRDHGTDQFITKRVFRALAQRGKDLGRNFHRALDAGSGLQLDHARRIDEVVQAVLDIGHVAHATAHEALDRNDRVLGIAHGLVLGLVADMRIAVRQITHHGRQQRAAVLVGQDFGNAVAHGGHQRVGGAKVDTHGQSALMGRRRHAGFGNLEQCHGISSILETIDRLARVVFDLLDKH